MSLTAIVWLLLYGLAIVGAFINPIYGLFGYLLEYFQRPDLYWWGRALPDLRWNFTIAAVTVLAYLVNRARLEPRTRETLVPVMLLLLQALNTSAVSLWAFEEALSWKWSVQYWKLVVTYLMFSDIVRTPKSLALVVMFQIVGSAYWGWDGMDNRRTRGRLEGVGSGDTLNANGLAAHLLTIIPLITIFAFGKTNQRWMRFAAIVAAPLVVNLFILCNSRGATLGVAAAGLAAFLLVRPGLRSRVVVSGAVAAVALFLLADDRFASRQQTIADAQDNSAQTRLELWRGSFNVIADHPFGVGGRNFHLVSVKYLPDIRGDYGEGRSSHNTYIQTAADWGIQGLLLFVAFIWYTFVLLHRVRRERASPDEIYFLSLGIQIGLIGTLVAGVFGDRFFGESIYWLCGLSRALYCMSSSEVESQPAATVSVGAAA